MKVMKKIVMGLAVLATTAMLSNCSNDGIDARSVAVGKMGDVSIVDMRSAIVNNLLVAQTTFHNAGSRVVTGFYRCQFFDVNKMQVGDVQIWQSVSIYPNEDQMVKCMASQLEATEFKVEFSADGKNVSLYKYK